MFIGLCVLICSPRRKHRGNGPAGTLTILSRCWPQMRPGRAHRPRKRSPTHARTVQKTTRKPMKPGFCISTERIVQCHSSSKIKLYYLHSSVTNISEIPCRKGKVRWEYLGTRRFRTATYKHVAKIVLRCLNSPNHIQQLNVYIMIEV